MRQLTRRRVQRVCVVHDARIVQQQDRFARLKVARGKHTVAVYH